MFYWILSIWDINAPTVAQGTRIKPKFDCTSELLDAVYE
jgi:hypothetical protein